MLWRVREGMQGLLAAMRPPGVSLIIEDICVPPDRLAEAVRDLQQLLGQHGFLPGVAGHASAGNLHFLLTPNFGERADLGRYEEFMQGLVELIVDKYDGSLKAEHGTGLNMAPYVEREWGAKATELMWRIKQLADPDGILGPGIVLNREDGIHLRNLKSTPEIEEVATKCIECGFCEPVCPSRNVTTTPRQRIVIRREMARQPTGSLVQRALLEQYEYDAIETCAADGSCMHACPVGIDTGKLIKGFRTQEHGERGQQAASGLARRYTAAEALARGSLRLGAATAGLAGDAAMARVATALRRRLGSAAVPAWSSSMPRAASSHLPFTTREGAAAVYMPACINRILGNPRGRSAHPTLAEALVAVSMRAGRPLWIPPDISGHCCGTPWRSKGYERGHAVMGHRLREALVRWSDSGSLPVVIDASSCSHGIISEVGVDDVQVLDSIAWVHDHLLEHLEIRRRLARVVLHPTCASKHLGLSEALAAIAEDLAEEVVIPAAAGCCGMAGDRGWLHPEVPESALRDVVAELDGQKFDACLSSNRTCEVALQENTGRAYESFVLALEEVTRE
jgi:D-lactate dehydrogenase